MTQNSKSPQAAVPGDRSIVFSIALLFGGLMVLFSIGSVLNTAFDWNLTFKGVDLPKHWDATIGLCGATVVFFAIWALLSYVGPVRRFGRQRPWIMALLVVLGLIGAIVGITIWDNANIKARHEQFLEDQRQDSLRSLDSARSIGTELPPSDQPEVIEQP